MNLFTPRQQGSTHRLTLRLSDEDYAKIGRGAPWEAIVTDLDTGIQYRAKGAPCSMPRCFCDAIARRLKE